MNDRFTNYRWLDRLRYAWGDLRHRPVDSLLNTTAIAVVATFLLVLGSVSTGIYRYQQQQLSEQLTTQIVASADPHNPDQRFTAARLAKLGRLPGVRQIGAKLELHVELGLTAERRRLVVAEGVAPGDPAAADPRLEWGREVTGPDEIVLPTSLFVRLGGRLLSSGPVPRSVYLHLTRVTDRREVHTHELAIAGLLRHQQDTNVYIPIARMEELDRWCSGKLDRPRGSHSQPDRPLFPCVIAFGPSEYRDRAAEEAQAFDAEIESVSEWMTYDQEQHIWAIVEPTGNDSWQRKLAELGERVPAAKIFSARKLTMEFEESSLQLIGLDASDPRWAGLPHGLPPRRGEIVPTTLAVADRLGMQNRPMQLSIGGDAACTIQTLEEIAEKSRASRPEQIPGGTPLPRYYAEPMTHIQCEPLNWPAVQAACAELRINIASIGSTGERAVSEYSLRAPQGGRSFRAVDVGIIAQAHPAFVAAIPQMELHGSLAHKDVLFTATMVDDPRRFKAKMVCGRWIAGRAELVLPLRIAGGLFPHGQTASCLGRTVEVRFQQHEISGPRALPVTISLTVVGISDGDTVFADLGMMADVLGWQHRELVFNESSESFSTPEEAHARQGYVRCKLYARNPDDVPHIVAELQKMGYRTEDHLAELESLRKLGQVLLAVVGTFVSGLAVLASIAVGITCSLNIRSKLWEIGLLRAHGQTARTIASVFLMQGFLLGLAGFASGSSIVLVARPWLLELWHTTFGLPQAVLSSSAIDLSWLLGIAGVVSTAGPIFAMVPSVVRACVTPPAILLQRRN